MEANLLELVKWNTVAKQLDTLMKRIGLARHLALKLHVLGRDAGRVQVFLERGIKYYLFLVERHIFMSHPFVENAGFPLTSLILLHQLEDKMKAHHCFMDFLLQVSRQSDCWLDPSVRALSNH